MQKISELLQKLIAGDRMALSRIISKIENADPALSEIISTLYPHTGKADVIGLTGAPGSGKSTLVDQLIHHLRAQKKKVAIVAVDPSSPFSGGAILGDRIRMQKHIGDNGVYIRSLGTRGQQGGLSRFTRDVVHALDAYGFDTIIIETAGVGQTELSILQIAHTIGVVLVPEGGDGIQMMKAGLMEIADIFILNKSDRPEADHLKKAITTMLSLSPQLKSSWVPPLVSTIASQGKGVEDLIEKFKEHSIYLASNPENTTTLKQLRVDVSERAFSFLDVFIQEWFESAEGIQSIELLQKKKIDPYTVSRLIIKSLVIKNNLLKL